MPTFQQYQQLLAACLKERVLAAPKDADLSQKLAALIDSLPYYGDPDWLSRHRGALCNLLQVRLPNLPIVDQKPTRFKWCRYNGPYSGYRDAFFPGVQLSPGADKVGALCLDTDWWGKYCVALLTDAVRKAVSIPLIDTNKLAGDLAKYHGDLMPALTKSCLAVLQAGFTPTVTALNAIGANGPAAAALLSANIKAGEFTANINPLIDSGGDGAVAAVWFLFNLWVTLNALGAADIDGTIRQAQAAGLTVPLEVQPGHWFNGDYVGWFTQLSGADLAPAAAGTIAATMHYKCTHNDWNNSTSDEADPNGYAQSFCIMSPLNFYLSG